MYRPASSAVGMYQITDGTFDEARRYCIHDHVVVEDGPWNDWKSCWFNGLYMRVVPSHAVEMTSAYLDRAVASMLERTAYIARLSLRQKQDARGSDSSVRSGSGQRVRAARLRAASGQRCGDHEVRGYVARVNAMKRVFARLALQEDCMPLRHFVVSAVCEYHSISDTPRPT